MALWDENKVASEGKRLLDNGAHPRDAAVEAVDEHYGYTMEFAPSPAAHRELYDIIERRLRAA